MKEYKIERLVGLERSSQLMAENSLNIAAMAGWELVCISDGYAFYVRDRKPSESAALNAPERDAETDQAKPKE